MEKMQPQEFEGRIAQGKDWREIVAWVGDLPPMPQVASRAISLVEDPDTAAADLTDLLSKDAALAARVLKIANSAMFSRQREITTLSQAIMIIGFKALKGIIVAATLRQMNKSFGAHEKLVWENSMATASCATIVSKYLKKRYVEEIFLLGLLHSLGQIVLLVQADTAKDFKKVLGQIKEKHVDYVVAEQSIYGFAHPLIGALVAKKWNFSPESCQIILHYRDPIEGEKPESELEEKIAVVQLADMMAHIAQAGSPEGYPDQKEAAKNLGIYLGLDPKNAEAELAKLITDAQTMLGNERNLYE